MTLAMLMGKSVGLNEAQLAELALGSLAHDVGKFNIPAHILKSKLRAKHEESFYREHGAYGLELATLSGVFGPAALSGITDHHEFLDGTGWPTGKKSRADCAHCCLGGSVRQTLLSRVTRPGGSNALGGAGPSLQTGIFKI